MFGAIETHLIPWLVSLYESVGYVGIVVAMAIESACIPLPSEIILPLAGWMVSLGKFNLWLAALAGTLGCVIGSTIAYWVGYVGGRPLLERYGRFVLISTSDLDIADRWFGRYGEIAIFLSRLLPVVRTFISLPAGIARMNFGRFLVYTAAGSFPWSIALILAGKALGDNWEQVRGVLQKFDYPIIGLVVLAVGWYVYHHVSGALRPSRTASQKD